MFECGKSVEPTVHIIGEGTDTRPACVKRGTSADRMSGSTVGPVDDDGPEPIERVQC